MTLRLHGVTEPGTSVKVFAALEFVIGSPVTTGRTGFESCRLADLVVVMVNRTSRPRMHENE